MDKKQLLEKLKKYLMIVICVAMINVLFGCTFSLDGDKSSEKTPDRSVAVDEEQSSQDLSEKTTKMMTEDADKATTEKTTEATTEETTETTTEKTTESKTEKSSVTTDIPPYSGKAYIELNDNKPEFTDEEKKSTEAFEKYSEPDRLGRCGVAFANICPELMPTEKRGEIGDVRPTGWHTVKYSEVIEDNYLYNRSHLIAYSLAGENANTKNIITGTRYLNQETMQIFEQEVLNYVRDTGNHVLYRVTPVFEGDNLVATGVKMEGWSVEDEGKGICYNVFCYNIQPHIVIDYATGDSRLAEDAESDKDETPKDESSESGGKTSEADTQNSTQTPGTVVDPNSEGFENTVTDFVVNTNSRKIHLPSCNSVNDMAEKNKWEYTGTLNELKEKGYDPCGRCLARYK